MVKECDHSMKKIVMCSAVWLICASDISASEKLEATYVDALSWEFRVSFGETKVLFPNGPREEASSLVDRIQTHHMRNEYLLNARIQLQDRWVWCKQLSEQLMTDPFTVHESWVSTDDLQTLKHRGSLETLLGSPETGIGPIDYNRTVIWQWRLCNGKSGRSFQAIEVTAALRPTAGTKTPLKAADWETVVLTVRTNLYNPLTL